MVTTSIKTGSCQCGNIRYELTAAPETLYACHCADCQKQSSSAFGMSLRMDPRYVNFVQGEQHLKTWITRGEDNSVKRCLFCPDCGTRIMHTSDNPDESVSIKAGSLDDTGWLQPIAHIWLRSAQPWMSIDCERYRCYNREPDDEAELARIWRNQNSNS
jgi:hypothetical protein